MTYLCEGARDTSARTPILSTSHQDAENQCEAGPHRRCADPLRILPPRCRLQLVLDASAYQSWWCVWPGYGATRARQDALQPGSRCRDDRPLLQHPPLPTRDARPGQVVGSQDRRHLPPRRPLLRPHRAVGGGQASGRGAHPLQLLRRRDPRDQRLDDLPGTEYLCGHRHAGARALTYVQYEGGDAHHDH